MATSKQIQQFLDSLDPIIRKAFLEDVALMRYRANVADLENAIASSNIEAALFAAGIRPSQWTNLVESIRATYRTSGAFSVGIDVPARFGMTFNITNPRAQRWIAEHSSQLVVEINQGQREAVQQAIAAGFEQGRGPRSIALDIVGRVSAQTGKRTGGVIGLHSQYATAVTNARNDLNNLSTNYFTRTRRDKRFDATVRKAIESGKPLPKTMIDRIVTRYEDRLLQSRAENIAATEAMSSMNAAGYESMAQVIEEGLAPADAIDRTWDSVGDIKVRKDHVHANGQTVKFDEVFWVGGYQMRYPGDTSMGAGADQVARCRCHVRNNVDFSRTA